MHYAIRSGDQLGVIAKEAASWESNTRIEGDVTNRLLRGEGQSPVYGLPNEILHLGVERIVPIVIPADVDRAIGFGGGPGEEEIFPVVEPVVVNASDGGSARLCVYGGDVAKKKPLAE
jgi:hypothetical protein